MLLGCVADDFTGASDVAGIFSRAGLATTQFIGVPDTGGVDDCEAAVVALKIRSAPVAEAVEQAVSAARWLAGQGCRQILFKYCSTFDSTPQGNIGPVADALVEAFGVPVTIACPAYPEAGRTVYLGHLFVHDRLLSETSMRDHPLNPMTDPDLRRWLAPQTRLGVGFLPLATIRRGTGSIRDALKGEAAAGRRLVVADAVEDADLMRLGAATADLFVVTGASGVAAGMARALQRDEIVAAPPVALHFSGPGVALCGSCSAASRKQVERYAASHPAIPLDPEALLTGGLTVESLFGQVMGSLDRLPMVYSTAEPEQVARIQERFGRKAAATALETAFGELAVRLLAAGVERLVVGGGETSGAVVSALGLRRFRIGPEIDPAVPALVVPDGRPLVLALKSGNFGSEDFFAKAFRVLGEG